MIFLRGIVVVLVSIPCTHMMGMGTVATIKPKPTPLILSTSALVVQNAMTTSSSSSSSISSVPAPSLLPTFSQSDPTSNSSTSSVKPSSSGSSGSSGSSEIHTPPVQLHIRTSPYSSGGSSEPVSPTTVPYIITPVSTRTPITTPIASAESFSSYEKTPSWKELSDFQKAIRQSSDAPAKKQ